MKTGDSAEGKTARDLNRERVSAWSNGKAFEVPEGARETPTGVGLAVMEHADTLVEPERRARQVATHPTVVEENVTNFLQVLKDELEPYRELVTIARTATKAERRTRIINTKDGEMAVTVYEEVPDMDLRRATWSEVLLLMGKNPKLAVQLNLNVGGSHVHIGQLLMEVAGMEDEQKQLEAYAQLKRGGASVVDAEFKEE